MTPHLRAQLLRFARVSALAFLAALPATGGRISWASAFALLAGAAETGLRQLEQVAPVPMVTAVPTDAPAPPGKAP